MIQNVVLGPSLDDQLNLKGTLIYITVRGLSIWWQLSNNNIKTFARFHHQHILLFFTSLSRVHSKLLLIQSFIQSVQCNNHCFYALCLCYLLFILWWCIGEQRGADILPKIGIQTRRSQGLNHDLAISRWPALPPELQPPLYICSQPQRRYKVVICTL